MAKHFQPVGRSAVHVLARLAAQNIIKEKLRDQGVRLSLVPIREITEKAQVYLEQHPELFEQALERVADHAESSTEKTQQFSTTSTIFRRS